MIYGGRSRLRELLRRAERAFRGPEEQRRLQDEGITVGPDETLDREALLAELEREDPDATPSVTVTINLGNTEIADRGEIEDPISEFVEKSGLGTWGGSGQGSIGGQRFIDISFDVHDAATAVDQIRSFVASRFPTLNIEVSSS